MSEYTAAQFIDAYIDMAREFPWIQGKLWEYERGGVIVDDGEGAEKCAACALGMIILADDVVVPEEERGDWYHDVANDGQSESPWHGALEEADKLIKQAIAELWPVGPWMPSPTSSPTSAPYVGIADWNDAPGRTVEDVRRMFARARELASE